MSVEVTLKDLGVANDVRTHPDEVVGKTTAMASSITIRVPRSLEGDDSSARVEVGDGDAMGDAVVRALAVFHDVERVCTRFDAASSLSRLNASPNRWHTVPALLIDAIDEAHAAYARTSGRFDPRILATLLSLGYGRSLDFAQGGVSTNGRNSPKQTPPPWRPRIRRASCAVHLGGIAIDLGGIGKGLSVRWASKVLANVTKDFLVEAGGDCFCAGRSPEGGAWRIAVEDPFGGASPIAVLECSDLAVATSSTRLRRWNASGAKVHHLIDPRTSRSGGKGLRAVTVVASDPASAEVMSKVLFLEGAKKIAGTARRKGARALWVDEDGGVFASDALGSALIWRAG